MAKNIDAKHAKRQMGCGAWLAIVGFIVGIFSSHPKAADSVWSILMVGLVVAGVGWFFGGIWDSVVDGGGGGTTRDYRDPGNDWQDPGDGG